MKTWIFLAVWVFLFAPTPSGAVGPVSDDTAGCIECHVGINPGLVADWKKSRMSVVTPKAAREKSPMERRVSFGELPGALAEVVVGCAECHTMNPDKHGDTFDHNGYDIHVVVTPKDCATCHPLEETQYGKNLMAHAYGNLQDNPVYRNLADATNALQTFEGTNTAYGTSDPETDADACLYCHGTVVEVTGTETRQTDEGEMDFPVLTGWPNQGVGRINPDGSKGSCSACHARHRFSIEMARKPHTCSECHKGPDVPAYKVYEVSKHGNLYSALGKGWDFEAVPWKIGEDLTAPTCATCHVSLLVSQDGAVIAERTHQFNNRLAWRLFGLIYAHPHPISPDTTVIKNKAGLPLPTELTGEPAAQWLIDHNEQDRRRKTMKTVCLSCHGRAWVDGHFNRYENTLKTTNQMTLTATKILLTAWDKGAAKGLSQKDGIFNEAIEKKWVEQWLFFGNSTRYASAMNGADYGVFANGRWYMSKNIQDMAGWLIFKTRPETK